MDPLASIIIVTRNRRDELERALHSCLIQLGDPEIIVIDDASSDGTPEMVRSRFPRVRLIVDPTPQGYIVQRNRAAHLASGEFLVSIDDDAEFSTPTVVQDTLQDFTVSPRIAAVAIPYTEPPAHDSEFQRGPDAIGCWITAQFVGTAYAVRREQFLELGGFDESLVHQGEERDFCIRLLQAGYHVRFGNSPPIRHHRSAQRNLDRMTYYGRRNDIRFVWQHLPFPQVVGRLVGTSVKGLLHGISHQSLGPTLRGISAGYCSVFAGLKRNPVGREIYSTFRKLRSKRPMLLPPANE